MTILQFVRAFIRGKKPPSDISNILGNDYFRAWKLMWVHLHLFDDICHNIVLALPCALSELGGEGTSRLLSNAWDTLDHDDQLQFFTWTVAQWDCHDLDIVLSAAQKKIPTSWLLNVLDSEFKERGMSIPDDGKLERICQDSSRKLLDRMNKGLSADPSGKHKSMLQAVSDEIAAREQRAPTPPNAREHYLATNTKETQ